MIHHPPFPSATKAHKRLIGASLSRRLIAKTGAEIILHGHTHIDSYEFIEGPQGDVPVIGVPAASHNPHSQQEHLTNKKARPRARYNLFSISGKVGDWSCKMEEFGFSRANQDVQKLSERTVLGG